MAGGAGQLDAVSLGDQHIRSVIGISISISTEMNEKRYYLLGLLARPHSFQFHPICSNPPRIFFRGGFDSYLLQLD